MSVSADQAPLLVCWLYRVVLARTWPVYPTDRRTLCIHEAGHLVVGAALGIDQSGAAVWSDGEGMRGHVTHRHHEAPRADVEDWSAPECRLAALQLAAWYQAGGMAEMVLHECDDPACVTVAFSSDDSVTRKLFERVAAHEIVSAHGPLYAAQRWACEILKANWPAVLRLADALDVHGSISAEEIRSLTSSA